MTADALALALDNARLRKALEHGLLVWAESGLDADGCSVCRVCGAAWGPGPEGTSEPWHREGNACAAAFAALARLAAALPAPDTREAEALLLCKAAVEAREETHFHDGNCEQNCEREPPEAEFIVERAHAAAVAALAAHERRRNP